MLLTFSHNDRISFFKDLFSLNSRLSKGKECGAARILRKNPHFSILSKRTSNGK